MGDIWGSRQRDTKTFYCLHTIVLCKNYQWLSRIYGDVKLSGKRREFRDTNENDFLSETVFYLQHNVDLPKPNLFLKITNCTEIKTDSPPQRELNNFVAWWTINLRYVSEIYIWKSFRDVNSSLTHLALYIYLLKFQDVSSKPNEFKSRARNNIVIFHRRPRFPQLILLPVHNKIRNQACPT